MIPSLHSLATLAILREPDLADKSMQHFQQFPKAGRLHNLHVLFVKEGQTIKDFLALFYYMQTIGNALIKDTIEQKLKNKPPNIFDSIEMEQVFTNVDKINSFRHHISIVSVCYPQETAIIQAFLKALHIPMVLACNYSDQLSNDKTNHAEDLIKTEHVEIENHELLEYYQVCFEAVTTVHEKNLILKSILRSLEYPCSPVYTVWPQ